MARKKKVTKQDIKEQLAKIDAIKQHEFINEPQRKDSLLIEDFEQQLSANEPVRELLTPRNIKFKTELTEEQRGAVSILYHAYRLCLINNIEFDGLKYVLDEYIDFGVSVGRKGRTEFVEAHRAAQQPLQQQQQGMPNQMNNMKI